MPGTGSRLEEEHDAVARACPRRVGSLAAVGLVAAAACARGRARVAAQASKLVLRVGTDQELEVLNPWHPTLVVDYEVFTLNYDLLVGFGQDLEPVAGLCRRVGVRPTTG